MMKETDATEYASRLMMLELQFKFHVSLKGTSMKDLGYGTKLVGKLDRGYCIATDDGKRIHIMGDETLLRDSSWDWHSYREKIAERFDGKEIRWFGQMSGEDLKEFMPYLAWVKKNDGTDKFFVGDVSDYMLGVLDGANKKFTPKTPKGAKVK